MATKNLARTIIEGGRRYYNRWERNYSHRVERVQTRTFLSRAASLEDGYDGLCPGKRPKVDKDFNDKLGAPRRWLRSQVGRPWDKVRSKIFTRFNPRSLAGQHIIYDHLLEEVRGHAVVPPWQRNRHRLYVDRHGILRERIVKRRRGTAWQGPGPRLSADQLSWVDGRRVAGSGTALFWLVPCRSCESCPAPTHRGRHKGRCCCPVVAGTPRHGPHHHYRQHHRLTREERLRFESLSPECQKFLRGPSLS